MNLKVIGAIAVFLLICAISAWLFLASIPVLVHQVVPDLEDTIAVLASLLVLAFVWWFASGRRLMFAALGWIVLAIPFASHAIWQAQTLIADARGARLPAQMAIENFRESPIFWSGFDGPVGMEIEFDLVHPPGFNGILYTPQIRMAPAYDIARKDLERARTFAGGYFKDWYIDEKIDGLTLLKPVLFQRLYDDHPPDHDIDSFDSSGRTKLVYRLHPGTIQRLESENNICLTSPSFGLAKCTEGQEAADGCIGKNTRTFTEVVHNIGTNLNANWLATGGSYSNADLGPLISEVLQARSTLQGDSEIWSGIQKRLEPAGLASAGFELCPSGNNSHSIGQVCFCRF